MGPSVSVTVLVLLHSAAPVLSFNLLQLSRSYTCSAIQSSAMETHVRTAMLSFTNDDGTDGIEVPSPTAYVIQDDATGNEEVSSPTLLEEYGNSPGGVEVQSQAAQTKQKSKKDRFELRFTCKVCETRNAHSISRHAYTKGTVIVVCPGCNSTHLIADNLNWIEDDFRNIEEAMSRRGVPVTRIVRGDGGLDSVNLAEKEELAPAMSRAKGNDLEMIDGISEEQALRIREAVQAYKRRNRPGGANPKAM